MPTEHHLIVERTARYYTRGRDDGTAAEIWIVLHGQGQLAASFLELFAGIDNGERLIVAAEGLSRFYPAPTSTSVGACWMTREDRLNEIRDYVDYLDKLVGHLIDTSMADNPRIILLGFSQGGATAARWATYGSHAPDRLVIWGSDVPPDLKMDLLRERITGGMEFILVIGGQDEYITPAMVEKEKRRLQEEEIDCDLFVYAGGHSIDAPTLIALAGGNGPG